MKRYLITFSLSMAGFLFLIPRAEAAQVYARADAERVHIGEEFTVDVIIDSDHLPMNAVEAELRYDTAVFQPIQASTGASFLQLWPEPPSIDEANGSLRFTGGIPGGTYAFDAIALRLTFRAVSLGSGKIDLVAPQTRVYMHNGHGSVLPVTVAGVEVAVEATPRYGLRVYSSTHPDQSVWYPRRDVLLSWETRSEALYSYTFAANPEVQPDELPETDIGQVAYADVGDGLYYFRVVERQSGDEWRQVALYRVRVDATPPEPFTIFPSRSHKEFSGRSVISFQSIDYASGISRYDVIEGERLFQNAESPYQLADQERRMPVQVQAYDLAGNVRSAVLPALTLGWYQRLPWMFWALLAIIAILFFVRCRFHPTSAQKQPPSHA